MPFFHFSKRFFLHHTGLAILVSVFVSSCVIPKKFPKGKPFITENNIEVKGGNFSRTERATLKQRLAAQLDDSSRIVIIDKYFIRHIIVSPPAFDTNSAEKSTRNLEASMLHLGYYKAQAEYSADTIRKGKQQRVHVNYAIQVNKPTLIDTVSYILRKPDLQKLAEENKKNSQLKIGEPITKAAVIGELNRLVELYRNNGYYKFTSEEMVIRGDTTVAALTTVTDDIFEQLQLLAEAQKARDSPTIKLAVVLNPPDDSTKLKRFYIRHIYILPDYKAGDSHTDSSFTTVYIMRKTCDTCLRDTGFIIRYHQKLFRNNFLARNMSLRNGDLYNQSEYYNSINSYTKTGVWQSSNIQLIEAGKIDSLQQIDLVVQLIPARRYRFEASIEASYSASSNTNNVSAVNAGNLLGLSGNISVLDRNLRKEGIKMTNSLRAGIEFNFRPDSNNKKNLINSNEISYSNSLVFPRFIFPFLKLIRDKRFSERESFINTKVGFINRINLFNLQTFNFNVGYNWNTKKNRQWVIKPLNIEFARLFNETDSFKTTLAQNPFLRYSFNTALVAGSSIGYRSAKVSPKYSNRRHSLKINLEESGLLYYRLGLFKNLMRQFVKTDIEYIYEAARPKSSFVFRVFGGFGLAAKRDTSLPFFKQYFGGGSNSMRAWPVRGIGRGAQPLAPFGTTTFNDRTGDMQLESNIEYRYTIAQIIPNSVTLKGALFLDVGNIWNVRNSKATGGNDSAQFKFRNLYDQLGVAAGTGFRVDFNYFVLRFDLGFRIKKANISDNNGWQFPNITLNNLFKKGELVPDLNNPGNVVNDNRYKKWRYENFNFSIGVSYPF